MRKTITITYPAPPARAAAMLADPSYQDLRVERLGLDDASATVTPDGQGSDHGFVTTITGSVPPSRLPAAAARLVRSGVSFTVSETWGAAAADGSRTGSYDIDVKGAPVKVAATATMAPAGDATTVTVDVDLEVTVPLVGKSIEERAASRVGRVVEDEEKRAATWLAQH
ncbi:DUF2505 domain-containing protein [Actinomyces sp. 2119]|uniref:DUF2505 domain-containing protein n=1 Tax=Actinomyces sp. 2119 TaxID=2321393 RepID=UPI000E6C9B47|nr:DUF2505 domain-containing protein [Actinomyces sp. 2119]RJF41371.1 DUF2505 domain-containing protein [Actinomyces sp. 2119]